MLSSDAQKMVERVRKQTGYEVTVTADAGLGTWASMRAASRESPRHLITVNTRWAAYADYLVAGQCAMLLLKWRDPRRIPRFLVSSGTVERIVDRVARSDEVAGLPEVVRRRFCTVVVEGLLNQLQSIPAEIKAAEICQEDCAGLRGQQEEVVRAMIREMLAALAPRIRQQTPAEIFRGNAVMNAAFCLWWSERAGDRAPVVPFEALGFLDSGRRLLEALRGGAADAPGWYVAIVDRWAEVLGMTGWYEWHYDSEERSGGSDPV